MIVFRTGASAATGWGHLVRSVTIADEVKRLGAPTALVLDGDERVARRLGAERHPLIMVDPANELPSTLDAVRNLAGRVVLLDGYQFGNEHERALAGMGVSVCAMDDFGHSSHRCAGLIINCNLQYADAALYSNAAPGARLLLGPRYAPLRAAVVAGRQASRVTRQEVERVLVVLGGSDAGGSLELALAMLQSELPGAHITIAAAPPDGPVSAGDRIRWVQAPDALAQEMVRADIAISAGGMTSFELAYLGVPMLLLPATTEELPVSRELERLGAAICLRLPGQWTGADLAAAFQRLADKRELRQGMTTAGQAIFDGHGAHRISLALVEALNAPN